MALEWKKTYTAEEAIVDIQYKSALRMLHTSMSADPGTWHEIDDPDHTTEQVAADMERLGIYKQSRGGYVLETDGDKIRIARIGQPTITESPDA